MMSRVFTLCLAASLMAATLRLAPGPALAGDDVSRGGLESGAVEAVLSRQGYSEVRNLRRGRGQWLADASGPRGQKVRTVVDAFTGEITGLAPLQGSVLAPPTRRAADARL